MGTLKEQISIKMLKSGVSYCCFRTTFYILAWIGSLSSVAVADPIPSGPVGKSLHLNTTDAEVTRSLSFDSSLDSFLRSSQDFDHYDAVTLQSFKRLKEEAQPLVRPLDPDLDRERRASENALAIQGGRGLAYVINHSELSPYFTGIKERLESIKALVRYSVQSNGDSLSLSKTHTGKKLVEFSIDFNLHQGIDPQLRLGDNARIRYDFIDKVPLLEYVRNF